MRYWDVATETCLLSLTGHGVGLQCTTCRTYISLKSRALFKRHLFLQDYVRGVVASPVTSDLFLSCSYDHCLRLWDVRRESSVLRLDHSAPVEAALLFPSGGTCVSAGQQGQAESMSHSHFSPPPSLSSPSHPLFPTPGGSYVKVWDMLSGGRLLAAFSSHSKTVTSLAFDGSSQRLLSASLDQ